jgi:hypothetical protein
MAARTHRWRVTLMKTLARMRQEYVQEDYTLWLLEKQRMVSREMKTRTQDTLTFRCLSGAAQLEIPHIAGDEVHGVHANVA